MIELQKTMLEQTRKCSQLPTKANYKFDIPLSYKKSSNKVLLVQKTTNRTIVSLNYSKFKAKEVIRKDESKSLHSQEIQALVPSGARYAYDLIAFVGLKSYLDGYTLKEIHKEIVDQHRSLSIPFSSLYDLQRKFLFYLGKLHQKAAPRLKRYLLKRGNNTWLVDGTIEPGSPVFFGIKDACEGIFLGAWKIPTENETDISNCLINAADCYGHPDEILHDLSKRIFNACETTFSRGVNHRICHYHLARDLGNDLYKVPQEMLNKQLRAMKLQLNLKDQRSHQTQWFRKAFKKKGLKLVLKDLLNGENIKLKSDNGLGREVLLALHSWMLDYPNDGHRQGYPFDPYTLYFHRRIVKVYETAKYLLTDGIATNKLPKAFLTFVDKLEKYLTDSVVLEAVELYEKAFEVFNKVRDALRLYSKTKNPMHESYDLNPEEKNVVSLSLQEIRIQFREERIKSTEIHKSKIYDIIEIHLEKYESYLFPKQLDGCNENKIVRTTNGLESHWSQGKRIRRQTHGRTKLTRDFQSLPPEFMLVPNLSNKRYVELVLGSIDRLPEKLAEAGKTSEPFYKWQKRQRSTPIGRLPNRMLRNECFLDNVIGLYKD